LAQFVQAKSQGRAEKNVKGKEKSGKTAKVKNCLKKTFSLAAEKAKRGGAKKNIN